MNLKKGQIFTIFAIVTMLGLLLWPYRYGATYWTSWSDSDVNSRLQSKYGEQITQSGLLEISPGASVFTTPESCVVTYVLDGKKRTVLLKYEGLRYKADGWLRVEENSLSFRGRNFWEHEKEDGLTISDHVFESGSVIIEAAIEAIANNSR